MMYRWQKLEPDQIKTRIFEALEQNVNYATEEVLGIPASHLDSKVFYQDAPFLKDAPFISTLVRNPNHIGCHTLRDSEHFFRGTQAIEREVIDICGVDILRAEPNSLDGYVAAGGTEANIQACWVYRNEFMHKHGARPAEIALLCSEDSHYSIDKAANLLGLEKLTIPVSFLARSLDEQALTQQLAQARAAGKRYFIVVANMMTTMFGSVDEVDVYLRALAAIDCPFRLHVDGAYGGFYHPFVDPHHRLSFANPAVTSITLDAHKMVQAPYGTGLFLVRKNHLQYTKTSSASYVEGEDYTLSGSRSGANAVAIWMILMMNGPYGWREKIYILQQRTNWLCERLDRDEIVYYRHPHSNIVTLRADYVSADLAQRFGLVPDRHRQPQWYKIVVMEHVTMEKLMHLMDEIERAAAI